MIDGWDTCLKSALRRMSLDLTDDKSTLVQVMAWYHHATSHYLSQWWPSFYYCWVYFGVRMFCIGVVIVMLSSDMAWMYALIKKVITNHNMWSIFSTNVSMRLWSYFRLFLLCGHLNVIRACNEHLNPLYWWLRTRVYCPLRQGTRFIMYIIDISRYFFSLK